MPYHIDPLTNAVTAWYLGNTGSPIATEHGQALEPGQLGNTGWFVESTRGPVSQYPPGAAMLAAPLYWAVDLPLSPARLSGVNDPELPPIDYPLPPLWPATLVAVTATALAIGVFALTMLELGTPRLALGAGLVAAFATGAWSVASDQLWQHGPAMLFIALGVHLAARRMFTWSGLAFALGILTRPHIALIAAALGVTISWSQRSLAPALRIGAGSLAGLLAYLGWNTWLYGEPSLSGGYSSVFLDQLASRSLAGFAMNVGGALVSVRHGVLVWAPFLVVLLFGLRAGWTRSPDWVKGAALGGLLYLLVQLRANRYSGGDGHFAYRYPLEALMAGSALLGVSYATWVSVRPLRRRLFVYGVLLAVTGQMVGAIL
jgi:hypothetical protein